MLKDPGSRSGINLSVSNPTGCFFFFHQFLPLNDDGEGYSISQTHSIWDIYISLWFSWKLGIWNVLVCLFHVLCFGGALFWMLWDTRSAGVNVRAARDQVECATGSWSAKILLTWSRRRGPSSSARHTENKQRYIRNIIHIDR